ncbi:MAG: flagellar biosynthesis protein FlhB [Proteobacteria bacterium]|jgi:flagellar biosynthetic protein FlhB|nr:flagellar biosynthesis protein FlhB [Alphaproteobacteria bacterium]MDA0909262.1 flagellar biosynthesis protein FlhB [Pseudomonadota bacterium]
MAEENDSQEKTEDPSQRKLDKAREEGRVLSSKEMFVFTGMLAGLAIISMVPIFGGRMLQTWGSLFIFDHPEILEGAWLARVEVVFWNFILLMAIVAVPIVLVVLLTQLAVGGINFSAKALSFKGNRINPISGLGRIFSVKGLVELGKSLLKVGLLFGIATVVIYQFIPRVVPLTQSTMNQALEMMLFGLQVLIGMLLIALLIIAAIDYFWQRHTHMQSLRMSMKELKDEMKETEGSPEVKAKIRRMQMEQSRQSSRQREALDQVADATAVIVNPTHFAVALRYTAEQGGAPVILAMGKGLIAERIIAKANEHNITVFRNPLLARALYFTGDIGAEISEKLYNAVAVVLAYIYRIDRGEVLQEPDVNVPTELQYDEFGQLLN